MEADDLGVVPAQAADVPGVIDLIARVFAEYRFAWDPLTEVPDLLAFDRHYLGPRGAFFVVRRKGRVVGSVGVERGAGATAELHRLYLDADLRGQGRGRALVEAVLGWCRASRIGHSPARGVPPVPTTTPWPKCFTSVGVDDVYTPVGPPHTGIVGLTQDRYRG